MCLSRVMRVVISGFFKLRGSMDVAASCCIIPIGGSMCCALYLAEVFREARYSQYYVWGLFGA